MSKKKKKSLYDDLEVSPLATREEIKRAYRKKMKKIHPDVGGSEEEFKQVQKAYLILYDRESRFKYDQSGEEEKPSDRKPFELDKQVEMFLIRAVFDIVDRHGENIKKINMQKALLGVVDNIQAEIKNRKNTINTAWKVIKEKYRAIKLKQQSVKANSTLYNILQQKLNYTVTQEIMKIRQDRKQLLRDTLVFKKVRQIVIEDCVDSYIEEASVNPLDSWDRNMAWGAYNPTSTFAF